jgi:glucose/arabinose dehydrogenase
VACSGSREAPAQPSGWASGPDASLANGADGSIPNGADGSSAPDAASAGVSDGAPAPGTEASAANPVDVGLTPPQGAFCSFPGSVVWTAQGHSIVPGGPLLRDLAWLKLPPGFCAHYFGTVPTARQLRFAPGGDLFVASPRTATTGGANNGIAGIVVLPDDNHDGVADTNLTFADGLPSVQGLMFSGGYLYYQDDTIIRRVLVPLGRRTAAGPSEVVTMMTMQQAPEHWPKVFDTARDGTVYISNGGTQGDFCQPSPPPFGGMYRLEADKSTTPVATGFRNPIAMRCEADHDVCLVAELAMDYSASMFGREKLVVVRQGDDWGYPCCATKNVPYAGSTYADGAVPDCSHVAAESDAFVIGHTPFGLDFEPGNWPAPWTHRVFLTLHGDAGSWVGARMVAIALDPTTGIPLPASELDDSGASGSNMLEFASGWDDQFNDHGRPAPVAFAPDGRLFLGDDQQGAVIWIAPTGLMAP